MAKIDWLDMYCKLLHFIPIEIHRQICTQLADFFDCASNKPCQRCGGNGWEPGIGGVYYSPFDGTSYETDPVVCYDCCGCGKTSRTGRFILKIADWFGYLGSNGWNF